MPNDKLDAAADAEALKPKMSKELSAKARARERQKQKAKEVKYARELFAAGVSRNKIAAQLGRSRVTVGTWVKDMPDPHKLKELESEQEDVFADALSAAAQAAADSVEHELIDARTEEEQRLLEMAKTQNSPADQYQAYVATQAMQLLRDNIKAIRGPRTVKEFDTLDQIVRRAMGLNPKGTTNGGRTTLQIDINLLNNHKATLPSGKVIDAEEVDEQ